MICHPDVVAGQFLAAPPTFLVIPSPSDVLLLAAVTKSPSGEWVEGPVNVHCYTVQQVPLVRVGLVVLSMLQLGLGFNFGTTSATSFTSTLSGTATSALNGTMVECFGPGLAREPENVVRKNAIQILGLHVSSNK